VSEFLKFTGKNAKNNFYVRDFRNAYRFRPDVNPPRQKFNGYVNFIVNRQLQETVFNNLSGASFRTSISSLVRRSTLPQVNLRNEVKNQYNKKRIVTTGVDFQPIDITVFDTINNEWLTLLMRYYSYLYMNPRNKNSDANRDVFPYTAEILEKSKDSFKSNEAGLNLQVDKNFFERIDIILSHGGKGVQYSLTNPFITQFGNSELDYASSDVMEFNMQIEYENFTTYDIANFDLSAVDLDRFENVAGVNFSIDDVLIKPLAIQKETDLEFLGNKSSNTIDATGTRGRTSQPGVSTVPQDPFEPSFGDIVKSFAKDLIFGGGNGSSPGVTAKTPTYDRLDNPITKKLDSFIPGLGGIIDTAAQSYASGGDVSEDVKNYAINKGSQYLGDRLNDLANGGG
jgi:hypothetical protein